MREIKLDEAKGVAIILVVLGHTIQNLNSNFDQDVIFRAIYSFHMPLFVLLAGASASYWVKKLKSEMSLIVTFKLLTRRIYKSAVYLLLPFVSWSVISYFYGDKTGGLLNYLTRVINDTDLSLWFLPCIFWCTFYLCTGLFLFRAIIAGAGKKTVLPSFCFQKETQLFLLFIVWVGTRTKIPEFFGSGFANFFHGGLFFFFLCGIILQMNIEMFVKKSYFILSLIGFALLAPFWSRLGLHNFTSNVPTLLNQYYVGAVFTVVVAFLGSITVYLGINILSSRIPIWARRFFALLGLHTLGLYAMHSYFISYKPYVLASILISLAASMTLERLPLISTLLIGRQLKSIGKQYLKGSH